MDKQNKPSIPLPNVLDKLSTYADILARFGPGSAEALEFYSAHQNLPAFAEHARDLERLEQEDWPPIRVSGRN